MNENAENVIDPNKEVIDCSNLITTSEDKLAIIKNFHRRYSSIISIKHLDWKSSNRNHGLSSLESSPRSDSFFEKQSRTKELNPPESKEDILSL